jgi:hypothetical protein
VRPEEGMRVKVRDEYPKTFGTSHTEPKRARGKYPKKLMTLGISMDDRPANVDGSFEWLS